MKNIIIPLILTFISLVLLYDVFFYEKKVSLSKSDIMIIWEHGYRTGCLNNSNALTDFNKTEHLFKRDSLKMAQKWK